MKAPDMYMGSGMVRIGGSRVSVYCTVYDGTGRFTAIDSFSLTRRSGGRTATLTLSAGEELAIEIGDGDPLLQQFPFKVLGHDTEAASRPAEPSMPTIEDQVGFR